MELEQHLVVETLEVHRLGLDDCHLFGDGAQTLEARERFLHVVQHAEVQHDVEPAELVEVDPLEVGDDRLDLGIERLGGEVEATLTREIGPPEVGLVACLVGEQTVRDALLPVGATRHEVDAPGIVIERDDPAGALLLRQERELAVPSADVEHALASRRRESRSPTSLGH